MGCSFSKFNSDTDDSDVYDIQTGSSTRKKGQPAPMSRLKALTVLNLQIDKEIARLASYTPQKALFLGTGESGKSTVFKQMRLCYAGSFDKFERYQYSKLIWADALRSMRTLMELCEEELRAQDGDPGIQEMLSHWIGDDAPEEIAKARDLVKSLDTTRKGFLNAEADSKAKAFLHSHVAVRRQEEIDLDGALPNLQSAQPIVTQAFRGYASMGENYEMSMVPLVNRKDDVEPSRDDIALAVNKLWTTCPQPIKNMVAANQVGFNTNAAFFLNKVMDMRSADYLATDDDILRARIKTTGISSATFRVKGSELVVIDVGGQRIERKKWIYGFDDVTCLLFVTAVSEYDQTLDEENTVNRLDEALETFKQTVNSQWFRAKSVQLFLNKTDILEQKCLLSPFSNHFPDYKGSDTDPEGIITYIESLFRSRFQASRGNRNLYVHRTCATDTSTMKFVIDAVSDMILVENLKWAGII